MDDSELSEAEREGIKKILAFFEQYGEPWLCRLRPTELQQTLNEAGFGKTFYFSRELANHRYFKNRTDGLLIDFTTQMMIAII